MVEKFQSEPLADIYCGNALDVLKELPDESVQMCMTSPAYWGLRNYAGGSDIIWDGKDDCQHEWGDLLPNAGKSNWHTFIKKYHNPDSHQTTIGSSMKPPALEGNGQGYFCIKCGAWKGQLGLEPTPELYVDHLMMIFQEVKRVLRKDGSFYLNIGDTYTSGKGSCFNPGGGTHSWKSWNDKKVNYPTGRDAPNRMYKGIPPKCMTCIPERVMFAMLADGWILRNKIAWVKPNNMPKSVKDRFTDRWEYLFFFVKARRYYFNLDAVRVPHKTSSLARYQGEDGFFGHGPDAQSFNLRVRDVKRGKKGVSAQGGELKASEEEIEAYPEKHHGSLMNNQNRLHRDRQQKHEAADLGPQSPARKHHSGYFGEAGEALVDFAKGKNPGDVWTITTKPSSISVCPQCDTVFKRLLKGCPHCGTEGIVGHFAPYPETLCIDPIKASTREGDTVLDMFAGSGTTGVAAKRLGRKSILIDCVRPYCVMARYNLQKVEYQPNLVL